MSSSMEGGDPATLQKIDRLVSASSPSDALDSLQSLLVSLRNPSSSSSESDGDGNDSTSKLLSTICTLSESVEFTTALCTLLSSSEIGTMVVEDGDSTAAEVLSEIITHLSTEDPPNNKTTSTSSKGRPRTPTIPRKTRMSVLKKLLSQPSDGLLINSLLDLLSPTTSGINISNNTMTSLLARTTALKILSRLTLTLPTLLHSQILAAPNGLHRIVDLLSNDDNNDESIRNEAILVCTDLAKTNVASARLMIFSDTYQKVLLGIAQEEFRAKNELMQRQRESGGRGAGGGMGWTSVVGDCLRLCIEMTRQVGMGADEFLGSRSLVDTLAGFLDLRFGKNFQCPEVEEEMVEDGDDLDAILGSGSKDTAADGVGDDAAGKVCKVPYLTSEEASVMKLALELLQILIFGDESNDTTNGSATTTNKTKIQSRQQSILSHNTLSSLLFDMALYTLPPPNSPHSLYVSAVPPLEIQLLSLDVMAALSHESGETVQSLILEKISIYFQRSGVLERLMYLICTGGGDSSGGGAATMLQLSMHALGVLRCVLSPKEASLMVWRTLAPPSPTNDDGNAPIPPDEERREMDTPVVQKLVNTLGGNLLDLIQPELVERMLPEDLERMNLNIVGAAGALGVFLTNGAGETTREMLLRVPIPSPPPTGDVSNDEGTVSQGQREERRPNGDDVGRFVPDSLVECILSYLEIIAYDNGESGSTDGGKQGNLSSQVTVALLRLLVEWVPSNPALISALLSSASSVALGVLLQKKTTKINRNLKLPPTAQALSGLLLGLCMENMEPEDEIGGWSRSSIMNLINVGMGISKFTKLLEGIKPYIALTSGNGSGTSASDVILVGPWACCKWERRVFSKWYDSNVIIIRRRAVQQLTLASNAENSDEELDRDNDNSDVADGEKRDSKSMRRLISQQTEEIECLRQKITESEQISKAQSSEIKMLQKRMQSNPTQLDDMMDEFSAKIAELEKEKQALVDEAIKKDKDHASLLIEKDDEISDLRELAEKSRKEIVSVCTEMDSIKEENASLSSAYTSLEIEYNRVTSENVDGNSSAQTGETSEQTPSQSNGDQTTELSSPEINVLRSENAKLKNDIRAADSWIKLAVTKMEDAGKMNSTLQAEIRQLKLRINSTDTEHPDSIKRHDTQDNQIISEKLATMERASEKYVSEIDLWRCKAEALEKDLERTEHDFNELKVRTNEGQFVSASEIDNMQEIEKQREELSEKVLRLQQELSEKNAIVQEAEKRVSEAQGITRVETVEEETNKLRAKITTLNEAYKVAQDWMTKASAKVESLERELLEKNKEVENMSGKTSEISLWKSKAELLEKSLENTELSLKELKAQTGQGKFISAAEFDKLKEVEKNNAKLSDKVSFLQKAIEEKSVIVQEMDKNKSEIELWRCKAEALEKDLERTEHEFNELKARTNEGQFVSASDIDNMQEIEKQREELSEKVLRLQQELSEKNAIVQEAEKRVSEAQLEVAANSESQKEETSKLRVKMEALSEAYKVAQDWMANAMQKNESMKQQLAEATMQNTELTSKLEEANDNAALERPSITKISYLEKKVSTLSNARDEVRQKLLSLEQQLHEKEVELDESVTYEEQEAQKRAEEMQELTERLKARDCEIEKLQGTIDVLQKEIDTENEKFKKLEKKSDDMNAAYDLVQQEKSSILNENTSMKVELGKQRTAFNSLQNEIEMLKTDNDDLSSERDGHVTVIEDMRTRLNEFQEWTGTAQQRISELKVEKDDANKRKESLEEELNQKVQESKILKERAQSAAQELEKNQSEILSMKSQISNIEGTNLALTEGNKVLEIEKTELLSKLENLVKLEDNVSQQKNKITQLIDELKCTQEKLEESRNEKETAVCMLQEENKRLKSDLQIAISQVDQHIREVTEAKSQWESCRSSLEADVAKLSAELQQVNSNVEALEEQRGTEILSWKEERVSLQSDIQAAISELDDQKREMGNAKSLWESHCTSLEAATTKLSEELQHANSTIKSLQEEDVSAQVSLTEAQKLLEVERQEKSLLEREYKDAQQHFESRIEEFENSISEHVSTIDQYQVHLDERDEAVVCAEKRIKDLTMELVDSTDRSEHVVQRWQENSEQLEATISELEENAQELEDKCQQLETTISEHENALETQHKEANEAISQWETRCNHLSEQIEILETQLDDEKSETKIAELKLKLKQKDSELQHTNSNLAELEAALSQMKIRVNELQDVEKSYSNVKYELSELKVSFNELNGQLSAEQEKVSAEIAAKAELEITKQKILLEKEHALNKLAEISSLKKDQSCALDSGNEALSELENKLMNTQSLLDNSTAKLKMVEELKNSAEEKLRKEQKVLSDRIKELEGEKSLLNELIDNHESDARDMKNMIEELEDELNEANDVLQSHITDEVSTRATEMATKALKAQLKDLREKHILEHDAYIEEKEARLSAEEEVERMKLDVSLLIHNGDNDGEPIEGQIRKLTSKAANAIVRKEREEIESLRSSLDRVMRELGSCRAKERDAEERAAKSRLHSSVCEQELTAAKSDIFSLKQVIKDLKLDSSSTRSSLEDRIKSIEYDHNVLVRSHANETETLKAEVARGQMERERLMHTLNESEKANSTLVYLTTIQKDTDGSSDEMDLAKLRLEKAQLLASASEHGAKFERRIREAVAANAASIEAEIILEKELRESAEKALSEMQRQYDELSSRLNNNEQNSVGSSSINKDGKGSSSSITNIDKPDTNLNKPDTNIDTSEEDVSKKNIIQLEAEIEKMRNENSALLKKLEKVEEEAKNEVSRLTHETKQVEAKHSEITLEEDFEAAVAAEVARINAESSSKIFLNKDIDGLNSDSMSFIDGDSEFKETDMDAGEMCNYITELKDAVREERESYHDLLTEHEDLLALLAQQDLERASLQAALSEIGGENAVERAVTEAEEKAVEQFGKYIRVK